MDEAERPVGIIGRPGDDVRYTAAVMNDLDRLFYPWQGEIFRKTGQRCPEPENACHRKKRQRQDHNKRQPGSPFPKS